MAENTVPDWLTGVWRRLSIETDGYKDTTTQVIWLQTHRWFGDIRIPANRPDLRDKSLTSLTPSEAIALSHQQGFAGVTDLQDSICQWHRYIDYQPPSGQQDIGRLYWEGDILIEVGVDAAYKEEWQQISPASGDFTALVLPQESAPDGEPLWQGCVVTAGDYFVYARKRSHPLPAAESLTALMTASAQSPNQSLTHWDTLNCELSFGVCQSGAVPWEIQSSTLPWREGKSLWSQSDLSIETDEGYVTQRVHTNQESKTHRWQICEWGTGSAYAQLFS